MALERAARDTDPRLDLAMRNQEAEANAVLKDIIRQPAQGAGAREARDFIGGRLGKLVQGMDNKVRHAAMRAQHRIAQLEPQRKASASARIVREEMDNALSATRQEESRLWNAVPKNEQAPTTAVRNTFRAIVEDTPRAQADDIPEKARRLLDPDQSNQAFGDTETIKELHGLYSAMREEARTARAAGNRNRARIADELADSLLEDMGARGGSSVAGQAINRARSFSQQLNKRFTRGSVGRILGHAREGGAALAPELTLDSSIGRGGTGAAVSADDIRRAVGGAGDEGMQDYLLSRFRDATVRNGQFDPRRAQDFVRQNDELLDRFPGLKRQMQDAERAQSLAQRTERRVAGRSKALLDPKQSRAAQFLMPRSIRRYRRSSARTIRVRRLANSGDRRPRTKAGMLLVALKAALLIS